MSSSSGMVTPSQIGSGPALSLRWAETKRFQAGLKPREVGNASPYGLNILDDCMTCPVRGERLFCNLSVQAAQRLNEMKSTAVYPKGAMLFIEGQQSHGVFVLSTGKVKLSARSREGKTIITKISAPGDALGLNAVVSGVPNEVTAEMMEPGQANFAKAQARIPAPQQT